MNIRNIAIIAHVDHGKTTLVDGMLKQTQTFRSNQAEMNQTTILDSNDQERERGITILAKTTTVHYKDTKINIIDTPGHADFGGEVERIINMADGALLIVDAAEGPLPQTRFVLEKALENKLKVLVVINKIDRKDAEPDRVISEVEDLFLHLANTDADLDFPVLYAVGRDEKAWTDRPVNPEVEADLTPLFDAIVQLIPPPKVHPEKPFKMLVSNLDFDAYKGTYAIGKVTQGKVKKGQRLVVLAENEKVTEFSVQSLFTSRGLERVEINEATPGDIISVTGTELIGIGHTLADPVDPTGYPVLTISEPTLSILVNSNTSPFAGRDGTFCTARQLQERLEREQKTNIGLGVKSNPDGQGFIVSGRGELHLAVLVEDIRREGFELEVGKPQVILKQVDGVMSEPVEELTVEIDSSYMGVITEELGKRRGRLVDSFTNQKGVSRMVYHISSRNLLGFRGDILTKTRGNGLFATRFIGYQPVEPAISQLRNGALIASESGVATTYALEPVQKHGITFISPGTSVYEGMIIGLNSRQEDLEVNVAKMKKSTNMRAASADMGIQLAPPVELSLEQSLDFIEDDELLEVTPLALRLRKRFLSKQIRDKAKKKMD